VLMGVDENCEAWLRAQRMEAHGEDITDRRRRRERRAGMGASGS
jgi:hypothetical protein